MRPSLAIAIYFCTWFITLFAVLPFFVRTQDEAGEVVPGTPESAPEKVNVVRIALANTVVATICFGIIYAVVASLGASE